MKTQYLADGVLVRPLETLATNFLSSLYYNGRELVDLLEDEEGATRWFTVMSEELGTRPAPKIGIDDLKTLRNLRDEVEDLYWFVVKGDYTSAACRINDIFRVLDMQPSAHPSNKGMNINFMGDAANSLDNFISEVAISASLTLTFPLVSRLYKCDGPRCVLFYTKGHSKQHWCSSTCGNRARVARHAKKLAREE